jgi:hypothetical protein
VSGPPIFHSQNVRRQSEFQPVGECFRRRLDHHRRRAADPIDEPGALRRRDQLAEIAAEEHPELAQGVGHRHAFVGKRPELALERLQGLRMADDRNIAERDVSRDMVEMIVGIDDRSDRRGNRRLQRIAEFFAERAVLLGVDHHEPVRRVDRAGVGIASRPDPCMDARGDLSELRLAHPLSAA